MGKKLETVRQTAQCEYPAGDIDRMLAEIEAGYIAGSQPWFWLTPTAYWLASAFDALLGVMPRQTRQIGTGN
jgi:hypothetical protein